MPPPALKATSKHPSVTICSADEHAPNEALRPAVLLGRMRQQTEVRAQEDDWTGRTDAATRRKLQNRLNQRIYRKDPVEGSPVPASMDDKATWSALSREAGGFPKAAEYLEELTSKSQQLEAENGQVRPIRGPARQNTCFHDLGAAEILEMMKKYEISARQAQILGSPRVDQLLTLIQFNVFRALISNTYALGFTMDWLEEDAISPWYSTCRSASSFCPESLRPTSIQMEITHHPWIDLFPIPQMRENVLLAGDSYDENELCNDLVDFCDVPNEKTGLIVWGEPWDPSGWEMSESFLSRWGWVVKGCAELLASTNYWRAQRGESDLILEL